MRYVVLVIVIAFVSSPLWSWLWWRLEPERQLQVLIIDKTVPDPKRNEHISFNWVLTHLNFTKANGDHYIPDSDYVGFFPKEPYDSKEFDIHDLEQMSKQELAQCADTLDVLYYADSYGVYRNEWYLDSLETEHSPKIYGGFSGKELHLTELMNQRNKLCIFEFNTVAAPTSDSVRVGVERTFNLKWSGWSGRYFDMLDTAFNKELPRWVVHLYEQHNRKKWHFYKAGVVLVHKDSRVVVLEQDFHLAQKVPVIYTNPLNCNKFGLPPSIRYPFWFDIMYSDGCNQVVSSYKLHLTSLGKKELQEFGIPSEFPAVIEHLDPYHFYYLAGDFADNPIRQAAAYFKHIEWIDNLLFNDEITARGRFFWRFYKPLIESILQDYYETCVKQSTDSLY